MCQHTPMCCLAMNLRSSTASVSWRVNRGAFNCILSRMQARDFARPCWSGGRRRRVKGHRCSRVRRQSTTDGLVPLCILRWSRASATFWLPPAKQSLTTISAAKRRRGASWWASMVRRRRRSGSCHFCGLARSLPTHNRALTPGRRPSGHQKRFRPSWALSLDPVWWASAGFGGR